MIVALSLPDRRATAYEDLQRQVSIATRRQGNVLFSLAQEAGGTLGEAEFVDRVTRDLAAGRFLLLVVGDGIAEGTRRIGEYLRDQPGLAFSFGLIEIAEYRHHDDAGQEHVIMQPRVLAQTALIERHVIRSEVPGLIIDVAQEAMLSSTSSASAPRAASDASERWNSFVARFIADIRFDDPGQPPPRRGGNGWMRLPLPEGLYVNLYRSSGERAVGAQVRLAGVEGAALYEALAADRSAIDAEFAANGLTLAWREGEVPVLSAESTAPLPWDESAEELQRAWLGQAGNQLVNSLRPRLQRLGQELAA